MPLALGHIEHLAAVVAATQIMLISAIPFHGLAPRSHAVCKKRSNFNAEGEPLKFHYSLQIRSVPFRGDCSLQRPTSRREFLENLWHFITLKLSTGIVLDSGLASLVKLGVCGLT